MLVSTLLALTLLPQKELRILFLGNSHTTLHDVPSLVRGLIQRRVVTQTIFGGFLNDLDTESTRRTIKAGKWDVVVLQAAKVSSSHKYTYSQAGGINIAKLARASGARTYYFVEWPRRGWDESDLQMAVYRRMSEAAGGKLVPICYAWDRVLASNPRADLWGPDGNHCSPAGAYLAACTLALYISGDLNSFVPANVDAGTAQKLRAAARWTWQQDSAKARRIGTPANRRSAA